MDPDETLTLLRATIGTVRAADSAFAAAVAAGVLADHAAALDEWLSKGGFLPAAWSR